jgi:hypothetical protein
MILEKNKLVYVYKIVYYKNNKYIIYIILFISIINHAPPG